MIHALTVAGVCERERRRIALAKTQDRTLNSASTRFSAGWFSKVNPGSPDSENSKANNRNQ
jgi:hypothetical protein